MASLMGLRKRLTVPQIEVVSDKHDGVLVIQHNEQGATITVRKPWEATWNASGPSFTVEKKDVPVIVAALQGGDAEWTMRDRIIPTDTFTAEDVNEAAVAKEVEARCSQLDIERAKAANIAEEKEALTLALKVQHMDDKHITRSVDGCPICEMRYDYSDAAPAVQHEVVDSEF